MKTDTNGVPGELKGAWVSRGSLSLTDDHSLTEQERGYSEGQTFYTAARLPKMITISPVLFI